jgi:hypothetical protein
VSDIDTAVVDRLKALDPERPIREADIASAWFETKEVAKVRRPIVTGDQLRQPLNRRITITITNIVPRPPP